MKQLLAYYDEVDGQGNRKHYWRSISHRSNRISDSTYLTRSHRYINQNGSKHQKNGQY